MKTCSQNSDFQHCLIVSYNRATTEHLACIAGGFVLESSKWAAKPHSSHGFAAHWCTCQPNHHLHKESGTTVSHCLYILAAVWSLKGRTTLTVSNEKKKVEKPIIKKKTFLECTSFLNHSFIISALLYNIYIFFLWNIGHFFYNRMWVSREAMWFIGGPNLEWKKMNGTGKILATPLAPCKGLDSQLSPRRAPLRLARCAPLREFSVLQRLN